MPVDPRLNCAAEICCPPPSAREAKKSLLKDITAGVYEYDSGLLDECLDKMAALDIEFAPGELMRAIRNLADHPNSKVKEKDKKSGGNISSEEAEKYNFSED